MKLISEALGAVFSLGVVVYVYGKLTGLFE
jgi:hypothetical protein